MAVQFSRHQMEVGRRLLKRLLPQAKEQATSTSTSAEVVSEVAKALVSHLTIDKLDAVVISEATLGGWHADLVFRDLPIGVASVIGSPVQTPLSSWSEANDLAVRLLAYVIQAIDHSDHSEQPPVFEFYNLIFPLNPEILQELVARGIREFLSGAQVIAKLREFDSVRTEKLFERESETRQQLLWARVHMAASFGLFRYPEISPLAPASSTRH